MSNSILVTGSSGFLGSHLVERLLELEYEIIALKRSFSNIEKINHLARKIKFYNIDEVEEVDLIFKQHKISAVINCAVFYDRDDNNQTEVIKSNVLLPVKLLQLSRDYKVDVFINTDSFFVYKVNRFMKNYTLSKKQLKDWMLLFKSDVKIFNLVLMHLYGDRDSEDKFIPFIIKSILSGDNEIDLTDGKQVRDFIYVKDVVEIFVKILSMSGNFKTNFYSFDIGSGERTSIRQLVETISENIAGNKTILNFGAKKNNDEDLTEFIADTAILEKKFSWTPQFTLSSGLKETIDYFRCKLNEKKTE